MTSSSVLRIYGSVRSPFARIPQIYLLTHGIEFEFEIINFLDSPEERARLESLTPINKVPLMKDGDLTLFDSRVIMTYLQRKHGLPAPTWEEENQITASYSAMDSLVQLFLMGRSGFDVTSANPLTDRIRARVPQAITYSENWIRGLSPQRPSDWNYASMSWYAALYWANARELWDIRQSPAHERFLHDFASAPGLADTGF